MRPSEIEDLLNRYKNGNTTPEENLWVETWYISEIDKHPVHQGEIDFEAKSQRIWATLDSHAQARKTKTRTLWPRIAVAASITLAVLAGGYFYKLNNKNQNQAATVSDIEPGKVAATLTLSNGKKIYIADIKSGAIAEEAGVKITKNENGELVYTVIADLNDPGKLQTLTTYRGETQSLILPDGSKVWLNAESSIKYPSSFASVSNRKVELKGEAYFEIAKDKAHPFIVTTEKQNVEVLGTHFNINSYPDEPTTRTTLIEGSIRVTGTHSEGEKILKPGMQTRLSNEKLTVAEVDVDDAIAWKEGYFVFDKEPLSEIMKRVGRWYNVEVHFEDETLKSQKFSGAVSRFAKVSQLLKKLELTQSISFRIEGQKIIAERKTN